MAAVLLVHGLAVVVGLGSASLYLAAFFFPEVHRRHDFFWSGLGLFYALVLWTCAGQMSGAVLLGQLTVTPLLGWLGWQTLALRRLRTPVDLQTPVSVEAWQTFQDETGDLLRILLGQTVLGRWFPELKRARVPTSGMVYGNQMRVSSLKDVEYEYLDDVEAAPSEAGAPRATTSGTVANPKLVSTPPEGSPAATVPPAGVNRPGGNRQPVTAGARGRGVRSQPTSPPPNSPRVGRVNPSARGLGRAVQTAKITAGWLKDVAVSLGRPKPKKPVIELPPRPPAGGKSRGATPPSASEPSTGSDSPPEPAPQAAPETAPGVPQPAPEASSSPPQAPATATSADFDPAAPAGDIPESTVPEPDGPDSLAPSQPPPPPSPNSP